MKYQLFAIAVCLLVINSVASDEMITYKTSQYKVSLDGICPELLIVILPHPDPTLCDVFVVCASGQPMVIECVEGFVFEPSLLSCIPGDREQCLGTSEPSWKEICADVSYAFLADPKVCWRFVFCLNGTVNRFECPVGEIWSQRDGACRPGKQESCELLGIQTSCQDRPDGAFPHPSDCSRYLKCTQGETIVADCSQGNIFNSELGKCVVGNTNTCNPHATICNDQTDGELIKHPNECDVFVRCEKGTPVIAECPAGEIFHSSVKNCAPGSAYTCSFYPLETVCQIKANGTIIPYPDSCNRFVQCIDGVPITRDCAEGTILHAPSGSCRPGNHQTCEFIEDACYNRPNGWMIVHPNFCHVFIRCESQIVTVVECPPGEILRPDAQVCVPGYACHYHPVEGMCIDRPDGQAYPHPKDCQSYVRCQGSKPLVETCDRGTIFRGTMQKCVAGDAITCSFLDRACLGRPDGVLRHPQSCDLFLNCAENTTSTIRCPAGHILHPELLVCAIGNVNDCMLGPVTTEPPLSPFCTSRPDGNYSHPLYCHQLIHCRNGNSEIISCPPGMIFDGDIERCLAGNKETCRLL